MGGAVKAVTKPVTKAVQTVVGGASKTANQLVGNKPEAPAAAAAPAPAAAEAPKVSKASAADEMMGARMRGARRRGRQLLSDARLNAESGVQTLGGGQNLG
jgi:hypothetical protein